MKTKTIVGFVADFPDEMTEAGPAGKELAEFIHAALMKASFDTSPPQNRENWAWDMCTKDGKLQIETIVGLVDDTEAQPPRQWLITNKCDLPFLARLFDSGSKLKAERDAFVQRFVQTIHEAMANDTRFRTILWYDEATFDKPGDIPSSQP